MLAGRSAFLACGGPSANDLDLDRLNDRGCWTLCVNNMAGHAAFRPQAFVCSDPPSKFSHSIWMDPAIIKFAPQPKMHAGRGALRIKKQGEFQNLMRGDRRLSVLDAPNVYGFGRRSWLQCDDTFFTDTDAAWGNHNAGVERTGENKTVCTMLLGMRLLRYLGARRVYLLGVDFMMRPGVGLRDNYAFDEQRDQDAIESNNRQYKTVNDWLCRMSDAGVFERAGSAYYNCYQHSGLRAFAYAPFEVALADVTRGVERTPDLADWYLK